MKINIDKDNDKLSFRLSDEEIVGSEIKDSGIIFDYNKDREVIGIEIFDIEDKFSIEELSNIEVEVTDDKTE